MDGLILGDGKDNYQKTIDKIIELKSQRSYLIETNILENNFKATATTKLRDQVQILRDNAKDLYLNYGESAYTFSGGEGYLTGTVSNQANPGEYEIEILELAKPQIIATKEVDPKLTLPSGVIQLKVNEEVFEFSFEGGTPNLLARLINSQAKGKLQTSWFRKNHKGNIFILKSIQAGRLNKIQLVKDSSRILHKLGLFQDNPDLDNKDKVLIVANDLQYSNVSLPPELDGALNTASPMAPPVLPTSPTPVIQVTPPWIKYLVNELRDTPPATSDTNSITSSLSTTSAISKIIKPLPLSPGVTVLLNKEVSFDEIENISFSYLWSSIAFKKIQGQVFELLRESHLSFSSATTSVTNSTNSVEVNHISNTANSTNIITSPVKLDIENVGKKLQALLAREIQVDLKYQARGQEKVFTLKGIQSKRDGVFRRIKFDNTTLNIRGDELKLISLKLHFPNLPWLEAVIRPSISTVKYKKRIKPEDLFVNQNELQPAQGARFIYQSIELERDVNQVSDLIDGVVLDLKQPSDEPVKFKVEVNSKSVSDKMVSFIGEYNRTIEYINIFLAPDLKALGVDKLSDEMADKIGVLKRQFFLRRMKDRMRNIMISPYFVNYQGGTVLLTQFGVENNYNTAQPTHIDVDKLKFDVDKFDNEIAKKGDNYRSVFSYDSDEDGIPDNGFAWKINEFATELLSPNSFLRNFVLGRETDNKRLTTNLEREQDRIDKARSKLVEDFGQVEALKQEQEQFKGFLDGLGGNK